MKLVYIANIRLPTEKAHGIQIMKMCEALGGEGLSVELLVPRRINDLPEDPFDFYGVKRNFKITRIPCLDLVNFGVFRIGFLMATLSFFLFARFYLYFRSYDVIYSREPLASLFFRNYILELHSWPRQSNLLLSRPKKIMALTSFLKDDLRKLGIPEAKITVVPDAVDLAEFDLAVSKEGARQKLNLPLNKTIILYTGSFLFYSWKGVDTLLEAGKLLADYLFVLVGGHPWEIKKLKDSSLPPNVLLLPYQKYDSMPYYLKSADVLVIPNKRGENISEKYTSPLKLFEYMAAKRPIVSSDLPSLKEVLTDNEAVFFEAGNVHDLIRAIKEINGNSELSERLAFNAFRKVKNYTWKERAKKVLKEIL